MQENNWYDHAEELLPAQLKQLGRTLIVAPHQDDESLGCGGTICLLKQLKIPVQVVFVSDGSMSHPNSVKFPKDKRVRLREKESVKALEILGVNAACIRFLGLPDGQVPAAHMPDFDQAVDAFLEEMARFEAQTVFVPWRRDPHPDHRATWQIVEQAIARTGRPIRKLEYFIWLWERAGLDDLPAAGECKVWSVNIKPAQPFKKRAVLAHVSQTTTLINDDPEGFTLSEEVLSHFDKPFEIFTENV